MSRRFIAGATCPQCQALDRIVLIQSEQGEAIECVACGHYEARPTEKSDPPSRSDNRVQVVTLQPSKREGDT